MARQLGTDDPRRFGDAFQVRWSRAPEQKKRNYGEVFHNSPGFDALDLIAQDVANAEYKIFDKRKYKLDHEKAVEIRNHPILELLDDPCPGHKELDGFMLKYMTTAYLRMVGEFFWVIERNGSGFPVALYPVLPTWVVQTWSVTFPMYRIIPQGVTSNREILVDGNDIIWFKNPSLIDPFGRGRGRDEAIGDELESDEYAAKYQKNLFYNDGQPPMIVSLPDADSTVTENLKENWLQKISGWMNARKPMFANTKVEVQKLTDSVREMDMVESRKALRDIFNQHYAIPPEMRGILENSNRSTIDSADYLYKKNVLSRAISRFLQILNRQLVAQFDKNLILVATDVVSEDVETKKKDALAAFQAGAITENEMRRVFGYADAPDGNVRLRPNSVTMIETGKGNVKPEPIAPIVAPEKVPSAPSKAINKAFSAERKAMHWKAFDTKATSGENAFAKVVAEIAEEQRKTFFGHYQAAIKSGSTPDAAVDIATAKTFPGKAHVDVFNALSPEWVKSVKEGAVLGAEILGASIDFDMVNPVLMAWVKDHGLEAAKEINGTTQDYLKALKPKIADAIEAGKSIDDIAAMIDAEFDKLSTTRAALIARTETMSSVNFGQLASYKADNVERKEWLATMDGDTRHDHVNANGQIVGIDDAFNVGGEKMQYPGDMNASAGQNCNCRCTILPVIE